MFKSITNAVGSFGRAVRIEYNARRVEQARRVVEAEEVKLAKMSKAQRAQHDRDTDEILRRAAELRTPQTVIGRAHSAARAKRDARRSKR